MTGTGGGPLAVARRRHRLLGQDSFVTWLCADVGLQVGAPGRTASLADLEPLITDELDAIVLTQAAVERLGASLAARPSLRLIVRTDWCSQWRALSPVAEGRGVTVSTPAQAAESGADAVIHYALLGHSDPGVEADYIRRAARTVAEAHAVGLPCVLEPLLRGNNVVGDERTAAYQSWAIRTAVELGADAVKVEFPLDPAAVIAASDVPVLIASTPPIGDDSALSRARSARAAGAAGVAYAADIFASEHPDDLIAQLAALAL